MNLKTVLADADRRYYAVGAFNVISIEMLNAVMQAGEEENSPIILAYAEAQQQFTAMDIMAPLMLSAARRSALPVVVHFDHGQHFEEIIRAIQYGFPSVMFDGSSLPYEENIDRTIELVRVARALGISVEAELGLVGSAECDICDPATRYTDVDQVADFAVRTGVDALAVSIGTAHGVYHYQPRLDLERLATIKQRVEVPLVLHGGSGLGDDDFRQAISRGIAKINIFTDLSLAAVATIRDTLAAQMDETWQNYPELLLKTTAGIREEARKKMRLFGSSGKAAGFKWLADDAF
jgi:fructose-bisphosphate aldolase class II